MDRIAMCSPLSPVIANFFMEVSEEVASSRGPKATCWFCYMDDTIVIWPHGPK